MRNDAPPWEDPADRTLPSGHREPPLEPERPRRGLRRTVLRITRWALGILAALYLLFVLLLVAYRFVSPPTTGVQVERRVEALLEGREYEKKREVVSLGEISKHLPRAVVAAEDGRFWEHSGFDWNEMRRATEEAARGGRVRGASTITQQLMKNLFGCTCRNPIRKVYDLALTPAAELILGKERILELYLNQVEWGDGVYGAEAAARHHYGVSAKELSRAQAAGLAALLPGPLRRTPDNTRGYRQEILRRMRHRGW